MLCWGFLCVGVDNPISIVEDKAVLQETYQQFIRYFKLHNVYQMDCSFYTMSLKYMEVFCTEYKFCVLCHDHQLTEYIHISRCDIDDK